MQLLCRPAVSAAEAVMWRVDEVLLAEPAIGLGAGGQRPWHIGRDAHGLAAQDLLAGEVAAVSEHTVEHVFGTLKAWMGATHFKTRRMDNVAAEMSLHVMAYNLKRAIAVVGAQPLIAAMRA